MNFNDLNWQNAAIKNVKIDRKNPGLRDTIVLEIEWPQEHHKSTIVFEEVFWASLNINFGTSIKKIISSAAQLTDDDPDLTNLYQSRKQMFDTQKINLSAFKIESTGSEIKIIAESFEIRDSN